MIFRKISIAVSGRYKKTKLGVGCACDRVCKNKEIMYLIILRADVSDGKVNMFAPARRHHITGFQEQNFALNTGVKLWENIGLEPSG